MPFDDLRAYLKKLDETGDLVHVAQEVDWNEEMGAIGRRINEQGFPAVLFNNVKDYPNWRVAGGLMSAIRRVAVGMDLPSDASLQTLKAEFLKRAQNPIKPIIVKSGPCKENIILGDQVDLFSLPAPFIHAGDGGRYLCTWHINVTKDPDSDWVNWGMYRGMIQDRNKIGILINLNQHIGQMYYQKYEARNQPMEIAIAVGPEPMCTFAATTFFPPYVNEADMAGAMRGKPIELVRCETVDLYVPATSELVIEGKVYPKERMEEGPFGEYTGYRASDRALRPVVTVTAITHRNDPIFTMSCEGVPVTETHANMCISKSAQMERELRSRGLPITGVWFYPESAGALAVVATRVPYANVAATIAHNVFGSPAGFVLPLLIVVPDDVDPHSWKEVMHTLSTRCHPYKGIIRLEHETTNPLDPHFPLAERRLGMGAKAYFDCTWPVNWDKEEIPALTSFATAYSKETQEKVLKNWAAYGFPEK
ncbi:MAG: UbiD family decarboxylase [Desulfobacterales bacterium]|nr:UbiD family decarboxylase [Desulfobacterales bacterium]